MDTITLRFPEDINVSLQKGTDDIVYFLDSSGNKKRIGKCTNISGKVVTCEIDPWRLRPSVGDYIFFGKENKFNSSGLVGYYAEVEMEVTSGIKKELFAVNSEVFISSN